MREFLFLVVLVFLNAVSEVSANDPPTTWQIRNQTKDDLSLTCKNKARGLNHPIVFPETVVQKDGVINYSWGDAYHNDGMGLNAGIWNCIVTIRLKKVNLRMSTDFGENLRLNLTMTNGKVNIVKMK